MPTLSKTRTCTSGCCIFAERDWDARDQEKNLVHLDASDTVEKAGTIVFDQKTKRVVLMRSYGHKWGFPKGARDTRDTSLEICARRELYEETGMTIQNPFVPWPAHKGSVYFFLTTTHVDAVPPTHVPAPDSFGVAHIRVECLLAMYANKQIDLNASCKYIVRQLPTLPHWTQLRWKMYEHRPSISIHGKDFHGKDFHKDSNRVNSDDGRRTSKSFKSKAWRRLPVVDTVYKSVTKKDVQITTSNWRTRKSPTSCGKIWHTG